MLHGRGRLGLQQQYEGQGRHHYGKEGYGQNIYSFGAAAGNGKTQGLDIAIATTWIGVGATRGHAGHHRVATPGTFERFADDGTIVVDVIVRVGVRQRRALVKADVYQLEIAYILRK